MQRQPENLAPAVHTDGSTAMADAISAMCLRYQEPRYSNSKVYIVKSMASSTVQALIAFRKAFHDPLVHVPLCSTSGKLFKLRQMGQEGFLKAITQLHSSAATTLTCRGQLLLGNPAALTTSTRRRATPSACCCAWASLLPLNVHRQRSRRL